MLRSAFDDIEEQAMKLYKAGVLWKRRSINMLCRRNFRTIHVTWGFQSPDYPKDVQGMGREEVNLKTDESASTTRRYHFHQPRSATKTSVFAARSWIATGEFERDDAHLFVNEAVGSEHDGPPR